jgi:hypothetical protein
VLDVLLITPVLWVTVPQPENTRGDVRWHVLDVGRVHWFRAVGGHEDFDGFVVIANGALIERTLDASAKVPRISALTASAEDCSANA